MAEPSRDEEVTGMMRRVARARLRSEPPGHILQTTALLHEPYLRLVDVDRMNVRSRAHLLAMAARLMRQVLVDHARRRRALKLCGDATMVSLSDVSMPTETPVVDVLALDEALGELMSVDPRLSRVVESKFFRGLSISESALALGVSTATVERDWTVARAWLYQRLSLPRASRARMRKGPDSAP